MKFILPLFIILVACSSKNADSVLEPEAFKSKIEAGATLIDVRTQEEYATGHISGSLNLDIKNPGFKDNLLILDPKKEYAVYCASGVRSSKAADVMRENGFTNVYTLTGGLKTWKEKGLPVE
jgi:rhodanese-related sulfurtransferase